MRQQKQVKPANETKPPVDTHHGESIQNSRNFPSSNSLLVLVVTTLFPPHTHNVMRLDGWQTFPVMRTHPLFYAHAIVGGFSIATQKVILLNGVETYFQVVTKRAHCCYFANDSTTTCNFHNQFDGRG